jgi:hypothetical protein
LDWFAEAGYQAQRLTSPAIPGVLSYRSEADHAFVAANFPSGMALREWVAANGPVPIARAMQVSSLVAGVLAQAHAAGWAHGWISPDTVWMSEGDVVSVTDLGLGLAARPMMPSASPYPAPPGFLVEDPMRRDMQCLGLLLTLLLTGRLPDPVGVPRGDIFPDDLPGGVVRRIRALIHPQTQHPPTPAEWADFAHVGESGVYTEPDAGSARHREPDAEYYDNSPAAPRRGRGIGPAIVTGILIVVAVLATWYFYGGTLTGTPRSTNVTQGSSTQTPTPPDHLTKVQVGPVAPGEVEKLTARLTRMGFEPFPVRESGEVFLQIGAFANADGARQAQSELRAAGISFRVQ